ncbi:MAG: DUF2807 domain-containing protein [Bacteroidales bacterium]|nr:DUF2807 domain-containing protein [Bacteroidales bacterium]
MKKSIILLLTALVAAQSCNFIRINIPDFDLIASHNSEVLEASTSFRNVSLDLEEFTAIDQRSCFDMEYIPSEGRTGITINAPENYIDYIEIRVVDGTLLVSVKDEVTLRGEKVSLRAYSSTLESVEIKGPSDFICSNLEAGNFKLNLLGTGAVILEELVAEDVEVNVMGVGDVHLAALECKNLNANVNGVGDINISGKADYADLSVHGVGDIDARDLEVGELKTKVKGAGDIRRK